MGKLFFLTSLFIELIDLFSQYCHSSAHVKQAQAGILKVVAGIAGLVFLLAPITGMGILISVVGLVVAIIAGVTSHHLSDDEDTSNGGYWPKDPNSPG